MRSAQARKALAGLEGDVLILYGDVPLVTAATMRRMLDALQTGEPTAVVLGFHPDDAAAYGRIHRRCGRTHLRDGRIQGRQCR